MNKIIFAAVVAFGFLISSVEGASLVEVHCRPYGSTNPPGDTIELVFLHSPNEANVTIEIRAYELFQGTPKEKREPRAIQGVGEPFRDENGYFLLRQPVELKKDSLVKNSLLIIPYANLQMPVGLHRVGYEVTVLRGKNVDFVTATPPSLVKVADKPKETIVRDFQIEYRDIHRTEPVFKIMPDRSVTKNNLDVPEKIAVTVSKETRVNSEFLYTGSLAGQFVGAAKNIRAVTQDGRSYSGTLVPSDRFGTYAIMQSNLKIEHIAASDIEDIIANDVQLTPTGLQSAGALDRNKASFTVALKHQPWVPSPHLPVYYATNRKVVDSTSTDSGRFGSELAAMKYGVCQVSIPLNVHRRGRLERPGWWESPDPEKHILVEQVRELEKKTIVDLMKRSLSNSSDDDILIYIHGFANTFESCILTGARLKHDTEFTGPVLVFSWPSEGKTFNWYNPSGPYRRDEQKSKKCIQPFADILLELCQNHSSSHSGKIHILAHSMGNQIVVNAMKLVNQKLPDDVRPFGHIVLAAPDVDVRSFVEGFPALSERSDDVTLYYCKDDVALKTSQKINDDSRMGQYRLLIDGLDNIDCRNANTSWIGHGYIVDRPILLVDLQMLMMMDRKPGQRHPPLSERVEQGQKYWYFP